MKYSYRPNGTCSQRIDFDLTDGVISKISFLGGCSGNLQGISVLCEGKDAKEVADTLAGINCGFKGTSCPDQLSRAIRKALSEGN